MRTFLIVVAFVLLCIGFVAWLIIKGLASIPYVACKALESKLNEVLS